jgi:hypothetical protein
MVLDPAPDCDLVIPQDAQTTPLAWDVDPVTGSHQHDPR